MSEQAFAAVLQRMPYARYQGLSFDATSGVFRLPFRDDLVGNTHLPAVHGGALGGFLENAAMIWLSISEAQRRVPKPVDFSVDFLRSARTRDTFARCEVLRQGRHVAQVQVRAWQDEIERPVVVGRGHFLLEAGDPPA